MHGLKRQKTDFLCIFMKKFFKSYPMRMFQRVKCGQIVRILSAGVTCKVRRCRLQMLKTNTVLPAVLFVRTHCYAVI